MDRDPSANKHEGETEPGVEGRPDIGPDEADHVDIEGEKLSRPDYEEGSPDIKP